MLDYHLQRLKNSADYFLFKFDEDKIETELKNITANFNRNGKYKIRLLLNKWGNINTEFSAVKENTSKIRILLSRKKRCVDDKFLYHKTTYRRWDEELNTAKQKGYDEVLFINKNDELLEGAISNLVIEKNGKLFTPAIELGILNGCYRKYLLKKAKCEEKLLILNDLVNADKIILCNSVRKEVIVDEVYDQTEISILNP